MGTDAVDYAWSHPDPQAIVDAGYADVIRYLSLDQTKNLTATERDALLACGLGIRLVWETTAARASGGEATGQNDAQMALAQAQALGYTLPIWFACDEDVPWSTVAPYYAGAVLAVGRSWVEPYGSDAIVEGFYGAFGPNPRWGDDEAWQTEAWSGKVVSPKAALYQRIQPTHPAIAEAAGSYDEDAVLHPIAWMGKPAPSPPAPAPFDIGGTVQVIPVNAHTDAKGEGWFPLPGVPWPVVNVVFNGMVPQQHGVYRQPGSWDGDNVGGAAQINLYGFPPNATVLVYVVVAAAAQPTGELASALAEGRPHEGPPAGTPDPRLAAFLEQ